MYKIYNKKTKINQITMNISTQTDNHNYRKKLQPMHTKF